MKKCLVVISVMCVVLLAGCGNGVRYLRCSKDYTSSINQTVEAKFVGDSIDSLNMGFVIKLSETSKKYIDTYLSTYKKSFESQYGKYDNVTVTAKKQSDSEIKVDVDMDYKAMSESDRKAVGMSGSEDYDVNKQSLEKYGYTCE